MLTYLVGSVRIEREGATSQLNLSAELHEMGKRSLQTRQE